MIDWISIKSKKRPKYISKEYPFSKNILILDDGRPIIGCYREGFFEWWSGSFCNTDKNGSQKTITHWAEINLPTKEK